MSSPRILLFTTTTGYQTRAFEDVAGNLGIELVYATDHCHRLGDAWRDNAIPVTFGDLDRSVADVIRVLDKHTVTGVVATGDEPALLAAHVAQALGLPWHSPGGAAAALDKLRARGRWMAAGLPVPWFVSLDVDAPLEPVMPSLRFPCVIKPTRLSASRGVIRADSLDELEVALARLRHMLAAHSLASHWQPGGGHILIEGFVPGREYALEGVLDHGTLHVLAIFDKPDPLDGPFFEETIYVTPPALPGATERAMGGVVAHAALASGLWHGPIHAECRMNEDGIFMLECAARPIGGLCARALRFLSPSGASVSLEELLLRHASGEPLDGYAREGQASGVMMIPVPSRGHFREVGGLEDALAVAGVEDVVMTVKPGQLLEPWPEGHSYPGFIFARGTVPEEVTASLKAAHARLEFRLDRSLPLV